MTLPWRVLSSPRSGNTAAEYEDAWAVGRGGTRFAVADGASEASFPGLWARLLAEAFVAARRPWDDDDWLSRPRQAWAREVDGFDLPWYGEIKREVGGFATLLGLAIRQPTPDRPGRWRATAVGDSCLVVVPASGPLRSFPVLRSAEFGNTPPLLGSRPGGGPRPAESRGRCDVGDTFLLMTDALAEWFLRRWEEQQRPEVEIARLLAGPPEAFPDWLRRRRDEDAFRNDDVTLLAIGPIPEVSASPPE